MEKKSTGLIVLVVILSILVVGLGGYICYDKMSKSEKNVSNVENKEINNTECETTQNSEKENVDIYQEYVNNLKKNMIEKFNDDDYFYIYKQDDNGIYEVKLDKNFDLYVDGNSEKFNKYKNYKIASNVIGFNIVHTGNGSFNTLYFIKDDGTVSSADVENSAYNNKEIEIKNNVGNYKNIVSISPGIFDSKLSGAGDAIFIDIDGNIYYN